MPTYKEEERLYRAQKKWNRASPAFSSKSTRFEAVNPSTPDVPVGIAYTCGTIEDNLKRSRYRLSAAFAPSAATSRSSSSEANIGKPQQDFYDVGRTTDLSRSQPYWKKGSAGFGSATPRFGTATMSSDDKDKIGSAPPAYQKDRERFSTDKKSRGAVGLISNTPRLARTPEPVCKGDYKPPKSDFETSSRGASAWAAPSRRPSRSPSAETQMVERAPTPDYPNKLPIGIDATLRKPARHSAFHSTTPRFSSSSTVSETPGPGAYASRFIAYGME